MKAEHVTVGRALELAAGIISLLRWTQRAVWSLELATSMASLLLATASGALQRNLRGIACAASKFTTTATRPDFAVHHEAIIPDAVSSSTPLPAVLTKIDPQRFPTLSQARKSLRRGFVLINGVRSGCGSTASPGDVVALQERVAVGAAQQRGTAPFPLDIVYEDDSLGIVVKPAGVCTHPPKDGDDRRRIGADGGNTMRTAVGFALRPPAVGTRQVLYRPHVCHRLDRLTSGLLLCAKTYPALVALRRGFAERTIHKEYRAVVGGSVDGDEGTIDAPLLDSRGEWVSAVTQWRVLSRARSDALSGGDLTELALWPKTGRTHQLRRHAADIHLINGLALNRHTAVRHRDRLELLLLLDGSLSTLALRAAQLLRLSTLRSHPLDALKVLWREQARYVQTRRRCG